MGWGRRYGGGARGMGVGQEVWGWGKRYGGGAGGMGVATIKVSGVCHGPVCILLLKGAMLIIAYRHFYGWLARSYTAGLSG